MRRHCRRIPRGGGSGRSGEEPGREDDPEEMLAASMETWTAPAEAGANHEGPGVKHFVRTTASRLSRWQLMVNSES